MRILFWIMLSTALSSVATAGSGADVALAPGFNPPVLQIRPPQPSQERSQDTKEEDVDLSKIDKSRYTLWNPTPRKFLAPFLKNRR